MRNKHAWKWATAVTLALVLTACGGSGGVPSAGIRTLAVAGDSLSDSGTFYAGPGTMRRFTVQDSADEPYVLWVERIAAAYGFAPLCAAYRFTGEDFVPGDAGCSNRAIGGARIEGTVPAPQSPWLSVPRQLSDAAAAGWQRGTLLAVDGGANDAADLIRAYLTVAEDGGKGFQELVATLLPQPPTAEADGISPEEAGLAYMQALADVFADGIAQNALDRGVRHVVIANIPIITLTPELQAALDEVEAARGAQARAQAQALFEQWIDAFNARLADHFASDKRVVVVDVARRFRDLVADPSRYGLTNVTTPLCGEGSITGFDWSHCTADALAASGPSGAPADWWEHYLFADGFHPTPYGHKLMGDEALETMAEAGWR